MNRLVYKKSLRSLVIATVVTGIVRGADAAVIIENAFQLNDAQFNQWVYGSSRSGINTDSAIEVAVDAADRACHLTPAQREKLRLAARGDIARFDRRVDELRTKYANKMHDQNDVGRIHQEIQPLGATYQAGLFGPSSLFSKALHGMLTPEQLARYNEAQAERRKASHAAQVQLFVAMLERRCPLVDKQRTALVELLIAETQPPTRPSQYDRYVILVQAARIPEEKFTNILDEDQYRVLTKTFEQARVLEQHLRQQGVLP